MTKRNASIELYRMLMMFCICWLHCVQQGGRFGETRWIYYLMRFSVVGFVFISGYFGINGGGAKLLKLIMTCFWGAVLSVGLRYIVSSDVDWRMFVSDVGYSILHGYWFLWAYIALALIAPILNMATDGDEKSVNARLLPFLILVFGWSYMVQIPVIKEYVPHVTGFGPLSFVSLAAIYVCARIVRMRQYDERMSFGKNMIVIALTIPVCSLGFSHYNSVFSLFLAFAVFCLLKNIKLNNIVGRAVIFMAPSMFSVYILHQCCRGFGFVKFGMSLSDRVSGCAAIQAFLAAIVVFVTCTAIDILFRRCAVRLLGMLRRS